MLTTDEVAGLAGRHQVVAVVGARGTWKSELADRLAERWTRAHIDVLRFDGGALGQPEVLVRPLADLLSCHPDALNADALPDGRQIRIVVDREPSYS